MRRSRVILASLLLAVVAVIGIRGAVLGLLPSVLPGMIAASASAGFTGEAQLDASNPASVDRFGATAGSTSASSAVRAGFAAPHRADLAAAPGAGTNGLSGTRVSPTAHSLGIGSALRRAVAAAGVDIAVPIWSWQWRTALSLAGASSIHSATDGLLAVDVDADGPVIAFDPGVIRRNVGDLVGTLGSWWETATRHAAMVPAWSLTLLDGSSRPIESGVLGESQAWPVEVTAETVPTGVVVLVHGLDEPGWIWDDLAPALCDEGHSPIAFSYANDGPVSVAADCLGTALMALRARGVERVDLVAHSMGGLVVRDVLTSAEWYDGDGRGSATLPAVKRVVMVATPHHGAAMARLQPISELKDHLVRRVRGTASAQGHRLDGDGEAAIDLMPGSAYLAELNARPLPRNVELTVVAGALSGAASLQLKRQVEIEVIEKPPDSSISVTGPMTASSERSVLPTLPSMGSAAATFVRDATGHARAAMDDSAAWLGDGLVTIDSACLSGVDDTVVVSGNHQSILKGWRAGSKPPAVKVILDRLRRDG